MKLKVIIWVGSIALIFLFLPSLAIKIWDFLISAPWQAKRWIFYIIIGLSIFLFVKWRWRRRVKNMKKDEVSLLFLAKQRLVKGEISMEEFREIRRELD
jgi:membrane protein implicated in regulation of membrane protease activity